MHNGVDQSGGALHTQEHTHESIHAHLHTHTGEHAHQHEGLSPDTVHTHAHIHTHEHEDLQKSEQLQQNGADKAEIVALLTYTLQHNHHHNEEMLQMQKQLRALGLDAEAEQLDIAISDFSVGNARLADILKTLQE